MTIDVTTVSPPSPTAFPPFSTLFLNYSIEILYCDAPLVHTHCDEFAAKIVYESNHESTLATGLIYGPCEALPPIKFAEETGVRTRSRARGDGFMMKQNVFFEMLPANGVYAFNRLLKALRFLISCGTLTSNVLIEDGKDLTQTLLFVFASLASLASFNKRLREQQFFVDREQCNWLRDRVETPTKTTYNSQRREVILDRLIWSTQFENFLSTKWTAAKRFGLESGETLIPEMKEMFDRSADLVVESIMIGMSHRGRLNILGNVVRKPLRQNFSKFSRGIRPIEEVGLYTGTGDVKYYLGTSYDRPIRGGKRIYLSLVANPSHLEALDPVVVGVRNNCNT
ncbi:2-oxoglutarate dehydrogenase, mitochondrial-like protein [Tanacetum coccineum]